MPGHGDHWEALYDLQVFTSEKLVRDMEESVLVDEYPCVDVAHGSERAEEVSCLRWGDARIAHDVIVVSDAQEENKFLFSAYPVLLDGMRHVVELDRFVPWEYGIEAWVHGHVTRESVPICFFDTRYYADSAAYQTGQRLDVSLSGLAYFLQPILMRVFEIKEGPFWEMERQRRLDEGEPEEEASRPVQVHMTGGSIFLPRSDDEVRDEAQFQGVIDAIDSFEHDGQRIYRLEMVVMRPGDDEFRLPVFVSEHVLDGYVPQLGQDVEGMMWVQGQIIGLAPEVGNHEIEGK